MAGTKQVLLDRLDLQRAEQQASFDFAMHLAHCESCRCSGHVKTDSTSNLCPTGMAARDKSIAAASAYAAVDPDFARRYALLIADDVTAIPPPDPDAERCHECGFPATVRLISWYCDTCFAALGTDNGD